MSNRRTDFVDTFPIEDVVALKNFALNGTMKPRATFLAVENVASYAAGNLLPEDRAFATAMMSDGPLSTDEIVAACDAVLPDAEGTTTYGAIGGLVLLKLLKAAIQLLPLLL